MQTKFQNVGGGVTESRSAAKMYIFMSVQYRVVVFFFPSLHIDYVARALIWQRPRCKQAGIRQLRSETKWGWKGKLAFLWWGRRARHKRVCLPWKRNWQEATDAECVEARRGERRTKPIFVSQLALPPDWAAPLCKTSHRKELPLLHTTGPHINVQMYARKFSEKPKLLCQMR